MKKIIVSLLIMSIALMGAGCGSSNNKTTNSETPAATTTETKTTETTTAAETQNATETATEAAPAEKDISPVTLRIFMKSCPSVDTDVARELTKKTGVTMEYIPIAGDPKEKLNIMLASDDLPDIINIDRGAEANAKYIQAQKVIAYDPYLDTNGKNIVSQLGDTLKKVKSQEDGKLYGIPSWFSSEVAPSPVFGFNIKMNYVKELGYYDKYISKGYFTQDEFYSLLKEWKEKYPTINGKQTIPMTFNADNFGAYTLTFMGMYGISSYFETDGKLQNNIYDPKYKEMIMFMNKLYVDGLLDKEFVVNKQALYDEKTSSGTLLCSPDAYWNIAGNSVFSKDADGNNTPDEMYYPFKVAADGIDPLKTTYGPTSVLGWSFTYVSSKCKTPERAVDFIDYLLSEEGQYISQWGVEGKQWEMKDGKRTIMADYMDQLSQDFWGQSTEKGFRKYELVFKSGTAQDGQNYDMWSVFSTLTGQDDPVKDFAILYLGDTAWDTTVYDDLGPDAGTSEALMNTKIGDIFKSDIPSIILSASQDAANAAYDAMVKKVESAGMENVMNIANQKYEQRMNVWGN